jgi:glutaredoxin-related protein
MSRAILDESMIHPAIRDRVAAAHASTLQQVRSAIAEHKVVVVGMAQNPHPKRACKALDSAGIAYHQIIYGSYFSGWRRRNALKMWTGWPTLPMVFVNGQLIGGADDLIALIGSGELRRLLG